MNIPKLTLTLTPTMLCLSLAHVNVSCLSYTCTSELNHSYRYMKHEMRHMTYLLDSLDSENKCPACPLVCVKKLCENTYKSYNFDSCADSSRGNFLSAYVYFTLYRQRGKLYMPWMEILVFLIRSQQASRKPLHGLC